MAVTLFILLTLTTTLTLLPSAASTTIGATLNHHPPPTYTPDQLTSTLSHLKLTSIRLLVPDPNLIRSFSFSPLSLLLTIPNPLLPQLASNQSYASTWLSLHVTPFYPRANISVISVGDDVVSSSSDLIDSLLPAITNLHLALRQLGLRRISVSTTFSLLPTLTTVFPPSSAEFQEPLNDVIMQPLLNFLEEVKAPFLINLYPYEVYREVAHEVPLGFALFQDSRFNYRDDPMTGVRYRNLFDVMVDAVLAAIAGAGHEGIPVIVTETGWPSAPGQGVIGEDYDANPVFAEMYLSGLVRHLKSGKGKKDGVNEVYVYELFDMAVNKSLESQPMRKWGILYPNLTSKYNIDFSGVNRLVCIEAGSFFLVLFATLFVTFGLS